MNVLTKLLRDTKSVYTRKQKQTWLFHAVLIIALLFVTAFLHPGIRPRWDAGYRANLFDTFISSVTTSGTIDPQAYWVFRERFSPGTFTINTAAVDIYQTFRITELTGNKTALLYYDSDFLQSTDSLVTKGSLQDSISADAKTIFSNPTNTIQIWQRDDQTTYLRFIFPIAEMQKANGFFDYLSSEMALIENTYWLHESVLVTGN